MVKIILLTTLVTTVILLGLGSYTITKYGEARYQAGISDTKAKQAELILNEANLANKNIRKLQNAAEKLSTKDKLNDLAKFGVLRDNSDY